MSPVAVAAGGDRRRACRCSSSAPATTSRTGRRCWRTGSARCEANHRRARGARRSSRCPTSSRWSGSQAAPASTRTYDAARELQPRDRALLRRVPVPLRVPEPRLRGVPRLLRLLQGVVSRTSPTSAIAQMVQGDRGRPVQARRRAEAAGEARGRARRRRHAARGHRRRGARPRGRRAERRRVGRRLGGAPRTRGSTSPRATACTATTRSGSTTSTSRSASCATTSRASRRATTSIGPIEAIAAERERITGEYRALLPDDEARAAFDGKLGLARVVFPYVENHNFYIEHWTMSLFWRKIRKLGQVLADAGLLGRAPTTSSTCAATRSRSRCSTTATAGRSAPTRSGPYHWPAEIDRRTAIVDALADEAPAAGDERAARGHHRAVHDHALGDHDRARRQVAVGLDAGDELTGMAASPGEVEGIARVVLGADDLDAASGGRDPRHPGDGAELGAGVRPDRRGRHRHRRHDEPRRDRLPRVRAAGRDRHGLGVDADQDRPARAGRRRRTASSRCSSSMADPLCTGVARGAAVSRAQEERRARADLLLATPSGCSTATPRPTATSSCSAILLHDIGWARRRRGARSSARVSGRG